MAIIYGSNAGEVINGTGDADTIRAWAKANPPGNEGPSTDNDVVYGGDGDDALYGGGGNDLLSGQIDSDRLIGGDGDDTLYASVSGDLTGDDRLSGGSGNDTLIAYGSASIGMSGGDGADHFVIRSELGGAVNGGTGSDVLNLLPEFTIAGRGDFSFFGAVTITDVETFYTDGATVGGTAAQFESFDTIARSAGDLVGGVRLGLLAGDSLDLSDELGGRALSFDGSGEKDVLTSGEGADTLRGNAGDDVINGVGGADQITGGAGKDTLSGGAGADTLDGGTENDVLRGGADVDTLLGGDGDDSLEGGAGGDTIDGGVGVNTLSYASSSDEVRIDLLAMTFSGGDANGDAVSNVSNITGSAFGDDIKGSNDANVLLGGNGNDELIGAGGADVLSGGIGLDGLEGGAGSDRLIGGSGLDVAIYTNSDNFVRVNLGTGVGSNAEAEGDTYSGVEAVAGSAFNDIITGSAAVDFLSGGLGSDVLTGGAGGDYISGGTQNFIFGSVSGGGDDFFAGQDRASYATSSAAVRVELFDNGSSDGSGFGYAFGHGGDAEGDVLLGISDLTGSAFNDVLSGYSGNGIGYIYGIVSRLDGGGGDDILQGGFGGDTFIGGAGTDTVSYSRASQKGLVVNLATGKAAGSIEADGDVFSSIENVTGSQFADTLTGSSGANHLSAGAGDDRITGGGGQDELIGGAGKDLFRFAALSDSGPALAQRDTIFDFSHAAGDRIDLSAIDANAALANNQAFTFIGSAAFSGHAGELRAYAVASDAYVFADVNGDRIADFGIHLDDPLALIKADFIL